ncbi:carboxypeptidase-like regulatory domain-containing protein [Aquimarina sp. RZ0]|uniref:carboxypeptidase-like regulatory domain-containing protein n=1 Tax=Aquimarina sp. RZ0 TaxID=2607730 RepID=UPI0011F391E1|nr:carboxypeptidase-like regulatory domain-containing protein [Aquimarina sp. RZ0]KAA1243601.1 carboxypeptidase-like regulatory domain-containing protein [Aquimarina sp. RZ0]
MLSSFSYGQIIITGVVKDTLANPITSSNVYLKDVSTDAIITFAYTDQRGRYTLKTEQSGGVILSFSALGYKTSYSEVVLEKDSRIIKDVVLNPSSYNLEEVVIISERAITEKKDTIIFNASSFKQGEETVVQDLLKKLPGVDVSDTGIIKVDGREVEKVMVEGDDFFRKGYKLLTKNLDVNAVDKVEVLRRYSNNKLLKGIEESEKVAINLKLDENFRRDWFGTIAPGYGVVLENSYDVDATVSSFGKKNKYFLIGSLNNIGEDVTEDVRGLIDSRNYGEPGNVGENQKGYELISLNSQVPGLKKSRTNFNNAELLSLNSIFKVSPKVNLKVLGLFNSDDNNFFSNGFENFFIEGAAFTNTENYTLSKNTNIGYGRVEVDYDISESRLLEYEGTYNNSVINTGTQLLFNDQDNNESLENKFELHNHKVTFSNRFQKNKVFVLSGRYIKENKPQEYRTNQFLFQEFFPTVDEVNNINQLSENKFKYAGFKGQLLDRKENNDLWDFSMGYEFRKDNLVSDFFLKEDQNIIVRPDDFSNNIEYTAHDLYIGTGYRKKLDKVAIGLNLEGHQLFNDLSQESQNRKESPFLFNSKFNFKWEINKTNTINAFAENKTSNASIVDVYSGNVLTGFRDFSRGLGTFNQLNTTTIFTGYNLGNFGDRFIANISLLYVKENDFISTNSRISQNVIQSTAIRVKDKELYKVSSKLDRYFRWIRSNFKVKLNYSQSEFKNIVNNNLRNVLYETYEYGLELRSGFRGIFNYHAGTTWNTTQVKTSTTNTSNQNSTFLDLSFVFSPKLNLQIQSEFYYFDNLQKGDKDYCFTDFELNYKPKNKNINFSLIGNNLLNTSVFRNFTVNDTYVSSTEYRLLPRYVLLKASYKF